MGVTSPKLGTLDFACFWCCPYFDTCNALLIFCPWALGGGRLIFAQCSYCMVSLEPFSMGLWLDLIHLNFRLHVLHRLQCIFHSVQVLLFFNASVTYGDLKQLQKLSRSCETFDH